MDSTPDTLDPALPKAVEILSAAESTHSPEFPSFLDTSFRICLTEPRTLLEILETSSKPLSAVDALSGSIIEKLPVRAFPTLPAIDAALAPASRGLPKVFPTIGILLIKLEAAVADAAVSVNGQVQLN